MSDHISANIYDDAAALQRSINGNKLALKKWEDDIKTCNRFVTADNATQATIEKLLRYRHYPKTKWK